MAPAGPDLWPRTSRLLPWSIAAFLAMLFLFPFDSTTITGAKPDRPLLIGIAALWLLSLAVIGGKQRPRLNGTVLHAALLFFVVTAVLSVLLNAETLRLHGELGLGMKKLLVLIFFVSLFVIVSSSLRPREARNFIPLIVGLGCVAALGCIWEYRTGFNPFYEWGGKLFPGGLDLPSVATEKDATGRIPVLGPTIHPLAAAQLVAMVVPFGIVGGMYAETKRRRVLYFVATLILLAGVFATQRKTGPLVLAAGVLTLVAFKPREMLRMAPAGVALLLAIPLIAPSALGSVRDQLKPSAATSTLSTRDRTSDYEAIGPEVLQPPGDRARLADLRPGPIPGPRQPVPLDPDRQRLARGRGFHPRPDRRLRGLHAGDPHRRPRPGSTRPGHGWRGGDDGGRQRHLRHDRLRGRAVHALPLPRPGRRLRAATVRSVRPYRGAAAAGSGPGAEERRLMTAPPAGATTPAPAGSEGAVAHDVCAIVVAHESRRWLEPALASLFAHAGPVDLDVVVVDNGSDGSAEFAAERFPGARGIHCANRGFAHANNRALEEADARYVLFLNPDTEVLDGTLADLVAHLDAHPEIGLAGCRQLDAEGRLCPTARRFPSVSHAWGEALGPERFRLRPAPRRIRARPLALRARAALRLDRGLVHARPPRGSGRRRPPRRALLLLFRGGRPLPADQARRLGDPPPAADDDRPLRRHHRGEPADGGADGLRPQPVRRQALRPPPPPRLRRRDRPPPRPPLGSPSLAASPDRAAAHRQALLTLLGRAEPPFASARVASGAALEDLGAPELEHHQRPDPVRVFAAGLVLGRAGLDGFRDGSAGGRGAAGSSRRSRE